MVPNALLVYTTAPTDSWDKEASQLEQPGGEPSRMQPPLSPYSHTAPCKRVSEKMRLSNTRRQHSGPCQVSPEAARTSSEGRACLRISTPRPGLNEAKPTVKKGLQGRLQDQHLTVKAIREEMLFSPRAGLEASTAGAQ